jgi:fructose-bisphosphate aldolase class II
MKSSLDFLTKAQQDNKWDPPSLFRVVRDDVVSMTAGLAELFGSAGKG